jgi:hypothetical protein
MSINYKNLSHLLFSIALERLCLSRDHRNLVTCLFVLLRCHGLNWVRHLGFIYRGGLAANRVVRHFALNWLSRSIGLKRLLGLLGFLLNVSHIVVVNTLLSNFSFNIVRE